MSQIWSNKGVTQVLRIFFVKGPETPIFTGLGDNLWVSMLTQARLNMICNAAKKWLHHCKLHHVQMCRILAIECVFFPLPTVLAFFHDQTHAHSHTNKEGAKTHGKAERRQRAVRFTWFLDYRLMFDSGRSFSVKYDLIRPPY